MSTTKRKLLQVPPSPTAQKAITAATLTQASAIAMATAHVAPENEQQVVIENALMGVFDEFAEPAKASAQARKDVESAGKAEMGVRETLLTKLANLSAANSWVEKHIETAVKAALEAWGKDPKRANHKLTTLAQFGVECRRAMHPAARDHVVQVIADSKPIWEAEVKRVEAERIAAKAIEDKAERKQATAAIENPLQKAFSKRYQMVAGSKGQLEAFIQASKPKATITQTEAHDVFALADVRQTAERTDANRAQRLLQSAGETLKAIYAEFPAEAMEVIIQYFATVTAEDLNAARNASLAQSQAQTLKAKMQAAVAATQTSKPKSNGKSVNSAKVVATISDLVQN